MRFEVEMAGRTRSVTIDRAGSRRYRVVLDGETHDIEAHRTSEFGLLLTSGTFPQKVPGWTADKSPRDGSLATTSAEGAAAKPAGNVRATHEVFVAPSGRGSEVLVTLDARVAAITVNGRRTGHAAAGAPQAPGEQRVTAPMPGRVVRVLVAPGDHVTARQGVVVVEAMKLENELRAPRAGRVREIGVAAGMSVEAGRVLVIIE
jgi:biotin carboxyl carrier protein